MKMFSAAVVALAGAAMAQPIAYSGTTVGGPTWNRPSSLTGLSGVGTATPYSVFSFVSTFTGAVDISSFQVGGWDGYLHVYANSFNPLAGLTNLIALDDDGFGGIGTSDIVGLNITAGTTYFVVTSGFGNTDQGDFRNTITPAPAAAAIAGLAGVVGSRRRRTA